MANQKKAKKPLRRAQRWGKPAAAMALKLAGFMVAVIVLGLIFSAMQAIENVWLRAGLAAVMTAGVLLLCMNEGVNRGAADAAASRLYDSMAARELKLTAKEDMACFHPAKPFAAALIVFIVPLALAAYLAATTTGYSYTLQDLPVWVTGGYGARGDVMAPLAAYAKRAQIQSADWVRMLVRLPIMVMINIFPDPLTMSGLIDRLSPLCVAAYPVVYVIGYFFGPSIQRRQEKQNRRAKKIAVRKAQKKGLAAELTGSQMQVHYGQKAESHKKKELV